MGKYTSVMSRSVVRSFTRAFSGSEVTASGPIHEIAPTVAPMVAQDGVTVTRVQGAYSARGGGVVTTEGEWRIDGAQVATTASYTPGASDVDSVLTYFETATETGGAEPGTIVSQVIVGVVQAAVGDPTTELITTFAISAAGVVSIDLSEDADIYRVYSLNAATPTPDQVIAGQDASGAVAPLAFGPDRIAAPSGGMTDDTSGLADGSWNIHIVAVAVDDGEKSDTVTLAFDIDRTSPVFAAATLASDGTSLMVTMSELLDVTNDTLASEWTVAENGGGIAVSGAAIDGADNTRVNITLDTAILSGSTVTVSYSGTGLRDVPGNVVASFTDRPVTNNSTQSAAAGVSHIRSSVVLNSSGRPTLGAYSSDVITSPAGGAQNCLVLRVSMIINDSDVTVFDAARLEADFVPDTSAAQSMTRAISVGDAALGGTASAIFHLINPPVETGHFEVRVFDDAGVTTNAPRAAVLIMSELNGVGGVGATASAGPSASANLDTEHNITPVGADSMILSIAAVRDDWGGASFTPAAGNIEQFDDITGTSGFSDFSFFAGISTAPAQEIALDVGATPNTDKAQATSVSFELVT